MKPHWSPCQDAGANTILQDIARARENIQKSLAGVSVFDLLQPLSFPSVTSQRCIVSLSVLIFSLSFAPHPPS